MFLVHLFLFNAEVGILFRKQDLPKTGNTLYTKGILYYTARRYYMLFYLFASFDCFCCAFVGTMVENVLSWKQVSRGWKGSQQHSMETSHNEPGNDLWMLIKRCNLPHCTFNDLKNLWYTLCVYILHIHLHRQGACLVQVCGNYIPASSSPVFVCVPCTVDLWPPLSINRTNWASRGPGQLEAECYSCQRNALSHLPCPSH